MSEASKVNVADTVKVEDVKVEDASDNNSSDWGEESESECPDSSQQEIIRRIQGLTPRLQMML